MSFQTCMFFRKIQKEMFQLLFTIKWKQMVIYTSKLTLCHRQNFFIILVLMSVMPNAAGSCNIMQRVWLSKFE